MCIKMLPIRKELFWDVEFSKLEPESHSRLIIERVLTLGNLIEFRFVIDTYDTRTITDNIQQIGYLDPKTISFVVSYFQISKEKLKCCTQKL